MTLGLARLWLRVRVSGNGKTVPKVLLGTN